MATTPEQYLAVVELNYGTGNVIITPAEGRQPLDLVPDLVSTMFDQRLGDITAALSGFPMQVFDGGADTVSTSNITLSGIQTVSGFPGAVDNIILVAGQTNKVNNGLYLMKSGAWVRLTGYTTAASLSNLMVGVNSGNRAGTFYIQPEVLPDMTTPKNFIEAINLVGALQAVAAQLIPTFVEVWVPIAFNNQDTIPLPIDKTVNGSVDSVKYVQPDIERTLKKVTHWSFDRSASLVALTPAIQASVFAGHEFCVLMSAAGTLGLFAGVVFKSDGTNLYYRLGNESDADLKLVGPLPSGVGGGGTGGEVTPTIKIAADYPAAIALASGPNPLLIWVNNDGLTPPAKTLTYFNPAEQGKLYVLTTYPRN